MNVVMLIGRLTKDPEVRYSNGANGQFAIAKFSLAVERKFKKDGDATADFINCVAMGKQAEFAEKFLKKGTKVALRGRIECGSFLNKNGQKVYTTDVYIEEIEFAESKSNSGTQANLTESKKDASDFMEIPDGMDDLPFN